ncbi:hypothetical protein XI06_22040 [Bradyrhizobium sp. CCBAU 11434]|nr:hypothetical protein [Bradyrhizobium sp. CCBAU 11434]
MENCPFSVTRNCPLTDRSGETEGSRNAALKVGRGVIHGQVMKTPHEVAEMLRLRVCGGCEAAAGAIRGAVTSAMRVQNRPSIRKD